MIYCLYATATNALLGVSETAPTPTDGQAVKPHNRGLPDFTLEEWNPAVLNFYTKPEIPLSKREFMKRLTPEEYATIKAAAAANSQIEYFWQMFMLSEQIVMTHPDTAAGLEMLEAVGLLAPGRAAEIMA